MPIVFWTADDAREQTLAPGELGDYGRQIQILIRYVHRQNSVRPHVRPIETESFLRQKMHWNGVARKRVRDKDVVERSGFAFQRQAGVPLRDADRSFRIAQESEARFGQLDH